MENSIQSLFALAHQLGIATQLHNTRMSKLLDKFEITYPQFSILMHMMQPQNANQTITQIASAVEVNQPAVTKIVKKFENMGLVTTTKTDGDSRRKAVKLTQSGADFIGRVQAHLLPDFLACFEQWAPEDVAELTNLLTNLNTWMDKNRL